MTIPRRELERQYDEDAVYDRQVADREAVEYDEDES